MDISLIGIDIAKNIFHLHAVNERGKEQLRKRLYRSDVLSFMATLPQCTIAMEACGGANYWAREFKKLGYEVRLISPQFVKPYVKSNKNDRIDAEAICEAAQRPSMRFVSPKSETQQDLQNLHRIRERLVCSRTALVNEIRGLLLEYGIAMAQGINTVKRSMLEVLDGHRTRLSPLCIQTFNELYEELVELNVRIEKYDKQLEHIHRTHPVSKRLATVPGIGPLTATAIVAAVANPGDFKNGREFAAWLGLVPRQCTTGGKPRLLGISKRGDKYIRKLLVHGARAVLRFAKRKSDRVSTWVTQLYERRGHNRSIVALANKNARMLWALLVTDKVYALSS
jgi:transposase